ncbi:hypothetical protein [Aestuariibaculum suncheonense]|uniref:Uncharacterized protein n=1 Tax=Aestuariibaculum suncheonense TaxID=1028745 RepID=A0A8J6Q7P3_9FLAO|nr:hypothetical protein [Aestuariibaculum suncheonense]MBD0836093.1 hypothetical protein [Aestuariibaculum suncheonense]
MKARKLYPNQYVPNSVVINPYFYTNSVTNTKEVILINEWSFNEGVSEMELNVVKLTAFDDKGNEHLFFEMPKENIVKIKGMRYARFLKSHSLDKLSKGTYLYFRFYLKSNFNKFIYSNGEEKYLSGVNCLDFKIKNKLKVDGHQTGEVKLWFDLAPNHFIRHLKPIIDFIRKGTE